jgi:hypothetical protein
LLAAMPRAIEARRPGGAMQIAIVAFYAGLNALIGLVLASTSCACA